eukprot:10507424-Alexandrium_andersonii.AAC.1
MAASAQKWRGPIARARPLCCWTPRNAARPASATTRASAGKPASASNCPGGCAARRRRPCSAG